MIFGVLFLILPAAAVAACRHAPCMQVLLPAIPPSAMKAASALILLIILSAIPQAGIGNSSALPLTHRLYKTLQTFVITIRALILFYSSYLTTTAQIPLTCFR